MRCEGTCSLTKEDKTERRVVCLLGYGQLTCLLRELSVLFAAYSELVSAQLSCANTILSFDKVQTGSTSRSSCVNASTRTPAESSSLFWSSDKVLGKLRCFKRVVCNSQVATMFHRVYFARKRCLSFSEGRSAGRRLLQSKSSGVSVADARSLSSRMRRLEQNVMATPFRTFKGGRQNVKRPHIRGSAANRCEDIGEQAEWLASICLGPARQVGGRPQGAPASLAHVSGSRPNPKARSFSCFSLFLFLPRLVILATMSSMVLTSFAVAKTSLPSLAFSLNHNEPLTPATDLTTRDRFLIPS